MRQKCEGFQLRTFFLLIIFTIFALKGVRTNFSQVQAAEEDSSCQLIGNWDFQGGLLCWVQDKSPRSQIWPEPVPAFGDNGNGSPFDTPSVRLGDAEGKGTSLLGKNGYIMVHRSYRVPADDPELSFDYLMYSYDIIASSSFPYDRFEVAINHPSSVVWFTGNPTPQGSGCLHRVWRSESGQISTVTIDLRDYIGQKIDIYFILRNQTDKLCNSWVYLDNIRVSEIKMQKTSTPPGPVHEGDVITYTIAYANTGLTTQTITLTDQIPFNVTLEPGSIDPPERRLEGSNLIWNFADVPPGTSDYVSFRVRVPLLPSLNQTSISSEPPPPPPADSSAYVLPAAVSCDTTRFWANGVTRQPPTPSPHTIEVQIPADAAGLQLALWLAVSGQVTTPPTIGGQPAQQIAASSHSFGASIWTADLTPEMLADGQITVVTHDPCQLNAVFLFDKHDPPFDLAALDDFTATSKTFTYTLDLPSVMTQTMGMLLPFLDLNYWDGSQPNTALTTVTTHFDQQSQTLRANQPNLGNGLLLTHFPLTIGPHDQDVVTKTLTVQVTTEDSLYTLGPRICRPVLIENTAWLCSDKAGCISAKVANVPETFAHPDTLYLPVILKSVLN